MATMTRVWWGSLLTVGALLVAFASSNSAQDKKAYEKHDQAALYDSLRDVINNGAKIFNEQGDHAGCYRLYQGSLLSVRPFLSGDLQKKIDTGLGNADKMASYADRAFELRRVLDEVRAQVKPGSPKVIDKKPDDKKVDDSKKVDPSKDKKVDDSKKVDPTKDKKVDPSKDKKVDDSKKIDPTKDKKVDPSKDKKVDDSKKVDPTKDKKVDPSKDKKVDPSKDKKADDKKPAVNGSKGDVAGKVAFQGKAVTGGHFVTLISSDGKKFSSAIQKDGSFQFKTPIPTGDYRIAIEPIPTEKGANLPARYRAETTSGLSIQVQTGKQSVDLNLVN